MALEVGERVQPILLTFISALCSPLHPLAFLRVAGSVTTSPIHQLGAAFQQSIISNMYNDSQWPYTPTYQQALHPSQDFNFSGDAAEPTQRSYSNNQPGFPSATGSGSGYPVHSYGVVPQFSNRSRSADQVYVPGQVQRPSQHHFANTLDVGSHQQQRFQQMAAFQGSSSSQSSSMSDSQPSEASERIIAPFLSASPVPTQTTFPQVTQPSPHASSSTSLPPKAKRPRLPDVVTTDEDEPMADHKEDMKAKS